MDYSLDIAELRQRYRAGQLTPARVIADIKRRIAAFEDHNIWLRVLDEAELKGYLARLQGETPAALPLYGVPFAIKDNIDLAGIPTTAACPAFSYVPAQSAFAVRLLLDAGAIPLGKTNLDQFACGLTGARSPYGAVGNAFDRSYSSGGSSSGSAVAVALGQVSFALGTDTAGSGRVPAAYNNLIGLKPTRGRISATGVVPACRSLDCVGILALNPADAGRVFNCLDSYDPTDSYARKAANTARPGMRRIGVPRDSALAFFGNHEYPALFAAFTARLAKSGYDMIEVDITPFIEAANLLYQGPWLAERHLAIENIMAHNPEDLLAVTAEIIGPAAQLKTVDAFKSFYQLQRLKRQADDIIKQVDCMLLPTTGTHYKLAEIEQAPIQTNSNLGYYTNFMNLLDYAAVAIPAGFNQAGLPFGVTLFAEAFQDRALLRLAGDILKAHPARMGATDFTWSPKTEARAATEAPYVDLAVCGAHLSGMPLNQQLTACEASLVKATKTAAAYRLYALAGRPPFRPGLIKDEGNGRSIEVEVWRMPLHRFGEFVAGIPQPLGIGKALLEDGAEVSSFICEAHAVKDARDITHFGGWRRYLAALRTQKGTE